MLKYTIGYEASKVIEEENFDVSIFNSQYRKALRLIDGYINSSIEDAPQITCFCGDRGDGKTSCMQTVGRIISAHESKNDKLKGEAHNFLTRIGCATIEKENFECLDIIDPSYFDTNHNILEVIIGKLYGRLKSEANLRGASLDRIEYRNLTAYFENVKRSIFNLHKNSDDSYSELTELDNLSSAIDLKFQLQELFKGYLKFIGKSKLLITIDDIDMNMSGAYEMCEHIRKYLSSPFCIIMMAVKFEQLEDVVAIGISNGIKGKISNHTKYEFEIMAQKYLLKLLPIATRIYMPSVYGICNQELRVMRRVAVKGEIIENYKTIKDAVVKLIFRKTRYLFYNSKGGVSLIVPNNLRQLMSMLGMLYSMEEIVDQSRQLETLQSNKATFKSYFFNAWPQQLPDAYRNQITQWAYDTSYSVINKSVVTWISKEFKSELERQYNTIGSTMAEYVENLIKSINYSENFSYNVSVGDVFYLLNLLNLDHLDVAKEKMLFFIKSLYSIMLYETYDIVTHDIYHGLENSSENNDETVGLYRVDHRFDYTNDLQRLVNGNYFSYVPGELLPTDTSRFFHFDKRIINGSDKKDGAYSIVQLLTECDRIVSTFHAKLESLENMKKNSGISEEERTAVKKDTANQIEYDKSLYRMGEFFIICISHSIGFNDLDSFYTGKEDYRLGAKPAAFAEFNDKTGYYVFDIMAPFYNLTNPEFSFMRFNRIVGGMFEFSCEHEFSLLRSIIDIAIANRQHIDSTSIQGIQHCLMSDAVLRNGEVISAIFENAQSRRFDVHDYSDLEKISKFYNDIYSSGMRTHSRHYNRDQDDSHLIVFNFLDPLIKFIKEIPQMKPELKQWFYGIFDYVSTKRKTEFEEKQRKKLPKVNLKKPRTILTEGQADMLYDELVDFFGEGPIGSSNDVFAKLCEIYNDKLKDVRATELIKMTENGETVNYDVNKIMEVIQQPRQHKQLSLWKKIFGIK